MSWSCRCRKGFEKESALEFLKGDLQISGLFLPTVYTPCDLLAFRLVDPLTKHIHNFYRDQIKTTSKRCNVNWTVRELQFSHQNSDVPSTMGEKGTPCSSIYTHTLTLHSHVMLQKTNKQTNPQTFCKAPQSNKTCSQSLIRRQKACQAKLQP